MKIVYFSSTDMRGHEAGRAELAKREKRLKGLVGPGVDISIRDNPDGPLTIETALNEIQALPGLARNLQAAQAEGISAGVLGCAGDPGFHGLRQLVKFPLIGPGHAAVFTAAMAGSRFSIFTPVPSTLAMTRKLVEDTGLIGQLGSIRPVNLPVLEIRQKPEETLTRLLDLGRRMIQEDDADVLILGCMSLAFQDLARPLAEELKVAVVDPVAVAVTLAEAWARIGLRHSPRFYHRGE